MSIYVILNIIYSFLTLCISVLYYFYEISTTEPGKYKHRLSKNLFDKYLDNNSEDSEFNDYNQNKKENIIIKNNERLNSHKKSEEYSIQDIISQIKVECRNFLMSEFKLIFTFAFILSLFFYFFGKASIALYFVCSFMIGIIMSLICAYYVTAIAVSNCEIVLNQSRLGIDEAFKSTIDCSSRMSILMMSIFYYFFFISILFLKFLCGMSNPEIFEILCGYGFGCTYSALFTRIGGGIFTKGADISCDVIGKIEGNLFENDANNPSSIADNVGDLVGDLAGSILDILASIAETFCTVTLIISYMNDTDERNFDFIILFFTLFSTSQLVFVITELFISHSAEQIDIQSDLEIENYLFKIIRLTTFGMIIAILLIFSLVAPVGIIFEGNLITKYQIMFSLMLGLMASYLITYSTYYYTGKSFLFIQNLAKMTIESPVLNVIYGLSIGFLSTLAPMIILAITVFVSDLLCGIFGVAFASFGFILNTPVVLLYQMFGPLADVSLGIISFTHFDSIKGRFINQLDISGNTMSAVVKGFASGSAALVSFGLYSALMISAKVTVINLYDFYNLIFLLIGAVFTYLIQALCMFATSSNATLLIKECRKQITSAKKESKPDYYECIQLSANHAFINATFITWLCVFVNFIVGATLKFNGSVSFLTGVIIAGIPITISSSNSGSAWDNSKKIIDTDEDFNLINESFKIKLEKDLENEKNINEDENEYENEYVGLQYNSNKYKVSNKIRRRSVKNAIIGDNIGDAFKDIAGPAINILIKFSSFFSLIIINYLQIK